MTDESSNANSSTVDQEKNSKNTVTKAHLAELLFNRIGLNKREAKEFVDHFFEELRSALLSGEAVKITGFGNFNSNGSILSQGNSNGKPDLDVPKVDTFTPKPNLNQYREYKFSVDQLPAFKSFRIKVIGSSTNQATVPMIRNFRAISLA